MITFLSKLSLCQKVIPRKHPLGNGLDGFSFAARCFSLKGDSLKELNPEKFGPGGKCPSEEEARDMPRKFRNCTNDTVFNLSVHGIHGARRERLVREIMMVDGVDWAPARQKANEMDKANDKGAWLVHLPYHIGVGMGFSGALIAVPLVFHQPTVFWFAKTVVELSDEEIPDPKELETFWQVGSFSWEYMEPMLGTLSFVLLGLQFMRAQMQHIQLTPYSDFIQQWRANRLAEQYPQYSRRIVMEFSYTDHWYNHRR
mmetsp:Transcript_3192/g.3603  ORF Transcript_3192/g.3603 Transcript_3192/m.3603 type:complete len:257 (+) Transcript_3192:116-886(+)